MSWVIFGVATVLAWTVLLPVGGPVLWLFGAVGFAFWTFTGDGTSEVIDLSAVDWDTVYWRTILGILLAGIATVTMMWVLMNGKLWAALGKAFGGLFGGGR